MDSGAKVIMFAAVFGFLLASGIRLIAATGGLNCIINASCSSPSIPVVYLKNDTGGFWNSHTQNVSVGTYPYNICCNASSGSLGYDCAEATVLKLSAATNAHSQWGNYTGPGTVYTVNACLSASSGTVECIWGDSCGSDYECLGSMASSEPSDSNQTNCHVGPCEEYQTRICCRMLDTVPPDLWFVSPTQGNQTSTAGNWIFVNVSASENLNTCLLDWYNGTWTNVTMDVQGSYCYKNMTSLTSGSYYFRVYANDSVGNWNVTEDRQITVDLIPPGITIASPQNATYTTSSIDLNVTVDENANLCWWNIDGEANESMSGSGTNWYDVISASQGQHHLYSYCNDTVGNLGLNQSVWFTVIFVQVQNTRIIYPSLIVARTNETVNSTAYVKYSQGSNPVYMANITIEVPYDFAAPSASAVRVYFIDYVPYGRKDITGNTTVNVSVLDQPGSLNTLVMVNISNISLTSAGGYMEVDDSIEVFFFMTSSEMVPGTSRSVYTNSTLKDNQSGTGNASILSTINSSEVVLRGDKRIWIPDLSNPQNMSVEIVIRALGGPVSGILLSDYLPQGATLSGRNVTYYNQTSGTTVELFINEDYYVASPSQDTLPDGTPVDVYYYNFSYNFTRWDGNLYDNDSITVSYNVSVLGGGQWILPAIIAGWDPTYKKNIVTETSGAVNVPLFDVAVEMITKSVFPGDLVRAAMRMLNVGGPRARVDVSATYSVKTADGGVVTEGTDTFAVMEEKEKELSLGIPRETAAGRYNFEVLVTYAGREAISARAFEVLSLEGAQPQGTEGLIYAVLGIFGAIIMLLLLKRRGSSPSQSQPSPAPGEE